MSGTVRITASVMTSMYHLPDIIANTQLLEPAIAIEIAASDDTPNLLYREVDIAVRMYQPTQLDLVTQHIGDIPLTVCASKSYLARKGPPEGAADLAPHDFVGYNTNSALIDGFREIGSEVTRDFFKVRCDDHATYWNLVRAGCGIGFAQGSIAKGDPDVVAIDPGVAIPPLPVWLVAHEAMRHTPRIRRVWEFLLEGLKPLVAAHP
jgi:DNA-binding transcriptional LysR family regulator